jgi:predicted DNA-binding transcriptional regulator AlpA
MATPKRLRTPAAADFIGISESWLEKLRRAGAGPRCIRLGPRAVLYDIRDLDRWIDQHREKASRPVRHSPHPDAA